MVLGIAGHPRKGRCGLTNPAPDFIGAGARGGRQGAEVFCCAVAPNGSALVPGFALVGKTLFAADPTWRHE